jgi:hypothetical protein
MLNQIDRVSKFEVIYLGKVCYQNKVILFAQFVKKTEVILCNEDYQDLTRVVVAKRCKILVITNQSDIGKIIHTFTGVLQFGQILCYLVGAGNQKIQLFSYLIHVDTYEEINPTLRGLMQACCRLDTQLKKTFIFRISKYSPKAAISTGAPFIFISQAGKNLISEEKFSTSCIPEYQCKYCEERWIQNGINCSPRSTQN